MKAFVFRDARRMKSVQARTASESWSRLTSPGAVLRPLVEVQLRQAQICLVCDQLWAPLPRAVRERRAGVERKRRLQRGFCFRADRNDATLMARQVRSHYNQEVCGNKLKPRRTHCVASENSW